MTMMLFVFFSALDSFLIPVSDANGHQDSMALLVIGTLFLRNRTHHKSVEIFLVDSTSPYRASGKVTFPEIS